MWLCTNVRETQSSIITLLNVVFLVLTQQKVVVCCLGLTSLNVFEVGSSGPHLECHWLAEAPSLYNAYKGQRAPASVTKTSQEHCTHAHTQHSNT